MGVEKKREQEASKIGAAASSKPSPGLKAFATPVNAYDFQRVLASLKNHNITALREYIVNHVPAKIVPSIFKRSSIETDPLGQVIKALHTNAGDAETFKEYEWLFALSKTYMADLQFSMLSQEELALVSELLEKVPPSREAEKKAFLKVAKM